MFRTCRTAVFRMVLVRLPMSVQLFLGTWCFCVGRHCAREHHHKFTVKGLSRTLLWLTLCMTFPADQLPL